MQCSGCMTAKPRSIQAAAKDATPLPARSSLPPFVAANCANHVSGQCAFRRPNPCAVVAGGRCSHFEDAVLPLAKSGQSGDLDRIMRDYAASQLSASKRAKMAETRRCGCGQPMPPRKRFCDACAAKNRRDAYRRSRQAKRLSDAQQLTGIDPQKPQQKQGVLKPQTPSGYVDPKTALRGLNCCAREGQP